jgi:isopropylmalate/homocitrate/citramalate synthase
MRTLSEHLIFDWNKVEPPPPRPANAVSFDDETLRDGLQSPSTRHPSLDERVRFLELAAAVGISAADVGLPGAGPRAASEAEALCRAIFDGGLPIAPNCAARASEDDIRPIVGISERTGRTIEVALFLASSPIRCEVEGWSLDDLLRRTERTVAFAVRHAVPVMFVAEDATRSHPDDLRRVYGAAVNAGATRICVADTSGHATPTGAFRLVSFLRQMLREGGAGAVGIDWHGHDDRGLAVANALAAAWAGADRLHATALGIGERVGNPPMEQMLVNARLLGWAQPDLSWLMDYAKHASGMTGLPIAAGAPVVGRDAFRTSTGVHASAIVKAARKGDEDLVDLVYSAVPASWLGRRQEIEVGPMSGASNIRSWLLDHGYADDEGALKRILTAAKRADRTLTDRELHVLATGRAVDKA